MREDPMIFEDWESGISSRSFSQRFIVADVTSSVLICTIFAILGLLLRNGAMVFSFFFIGIGLILIEYFMDQHSRLIQNRIVTFLLFISASYLFGGLSLQINSIPILIVEIILSLLFVIKLALIPLISTALRISGEILVPKTTLVHVRLIQELEILSATDYALTSDLMRKNRSQLMYTSVQPYGIALVVSILLILISLFLDQFKELMFFFMIIFLIFSGIAIASINIIWALNRRKIRKEEIRAKYEGRDLLEKISIVNRIKNRFRRNKQYNLLMESPKNQ